MKKFLIALLILGIIVSGGYLYIRYKTAPDYSGTRISEGMKKGADVYFDAFGIPHIYASNAEDAYQALGYVHAQDRLFQMEMMRRVGTGTLAEFLGADLVKADKFFRTLGIPQHAAMSTAEWMKPDSLNGAPAEMPEWKKSVLAYIRGVNQFIKDDKLPAEYMLLGSKPREFTLTDMHAIVGYMSFTFAMTLKTEPLVTKIARELGPEYLKVLSVHTLPEHKKISVFYPQRDSAGSILTPPAATSSDSTVSAMLEKLPVPQIMGSNAWVIAPSRTKSGQVLFCNDTHIGFAQPSVWYEAHLEYPGFSFYGNHLAGLPFGLVGHSREHSYGLTMFINDDMDMFEEKISPENPNETISGNLRVPMRVRQDTIRIKDAAPQIFTIRESHHGGIMNEVMPELEEVTKQPVAAWWVYLKEPTRALEATWKLSHARNLQEAESGARLIHAPGLNVMYGDKAGNIAWWASAKLPIRPAHVNTKLFLDGSTGADEPLGWYPFEENPMSVNPPSGFVASANNQPDTMKNKIFFPGYYYPGDRYDRIATTISSRKDWDQENIKALQLEAVNINHPKNAQVLLNAINPADFKEDEAILTALRNWKGTHELTETAPTLYYKWTYHVLRNMMVDELGEAYFNSFLETFLKIRSLPSLLRTAESPWWDDKGTEARETNRDIISEALVTSLKELKEQLGSNAADWKWESSIVSVHPHPLGAKKPLDRIFNVSTSTLKANGEGVNKLAFKLNGDGKYVVNSGPALRIILDFANVDASESVLPTGQSGNLFSGHYDDQAELYATGKYRPQMMHKETIQKEAKSVLKFTIK
ncbi:penicillin acylase family protein [Flavihumibacter stibioxidans]|uniref:Acyl-homoserine-lactone acylase n=1 Tax=Flavihumibacter stibioxidans TaxID=1834163 RepID=A0ABR7M8I1_9BACT|nr:penicillin acylase family protein [Flavihumibacter stibioxidans]MBC6491267.1 acyl-homoserine-lactone acylase [Flavihumibacter stibioxidans]